MTGLGPLEVALLRSVAATTPSGAGTKPVRVKTSRVLDHLEVAEHCGAVYGALALQHLGTPWTVPVPLFDLEGNWGSMHGDPPADPQYTDVGLSAVGALALAAEQHQTGPVPVDLVNGSVYRGGRVPPLDPQRTLEVLTRLVAGEPVNDAAFTDLVRVPTGGVVHGDLPALYAGRRARLLLSCRIEREGTTAGRRLVITGTPPGVTIDDIEDRLDSRVRTARHVVSGRHRTELGRREADPGALTVAEVRDESSYRTATRVVVALRADADLDVAERWVRSVWPVTVEAEWHIPSGVRALFDRWARLCRADPRGLQQLVDLTR